MTKEQFAILLKAKHIMVPQAEAAIAYLNTCDVETAVQGLYNLYLIAHNEFNTKVSNLALKALINLIPKTNKPEILANIYCIMAADYLKKRQFNKTITLYYDYKSLQLDNNKLNYNFDGFMLNVFAENGIYDEHQKFIEKVLANPYFREVDAFFVAVLHYNNALIAEETKDDELLKNCVDGLNEIIETKRHTKFPEKVIYFKELIEIFYLNYHAETVEEEKHIIKLYQDFLSRHENHQELKPLNIVTAHLTIIKTFINNENYQFAIKRLTEMLKLEPEVNVRVEIYKLLSKCYQKTDIEKYNKILEKLVSEYDLLSQNLQENLRDGIINTIKLYETRKNYNEIQKRYEIDQMTGCYNRNVLRKKALQIFEMRGEGAIIFFDLDNLKQANDNYNHSYGDEYLRLFVRGLQEMMPPFGAVFRYGGDEFIIVTPFNDVKKVEKLVKRIYRRFSDPIKVFDKYIKIDFSAGIALYPNDGDSFEEVLNKADSAMYEAKRGKKDYTFVN